MTCFKNAVELEEFLNFGWMEDKYKVQDTLFVCEVALSPFHVFVIYSIPHQTLT